MARTIDQQITSTYFALRVGAAAIGLAFPLLLGGNGAHLNVHRRAGVLLLRGLGFSPSAEPANAWPWGLVDPCYGS